MMTIVAKTRLQMTLKEFMLTTPREYYNMVKAWIKLNGKHDPQEEKSVILDEVPPGFMGI